MPKDGPLLLVVIAAIAVVCSLVAAFIQIPLKSKSSLRACFVVPTFFYWLFLSFGNVVTTILASLAVIKAEALAPYSFLFSPFFGVFGFEAVLKNTNITMFDRGVLTIQDWIAKALEGAAGAAIQKQEDLKSDLDSKVVAKLMLLDERALNARLLNKFGRTKVTELEAAAEASAADTKLYKSYQLVTGMSRSEARALLRSK